MQLCLVRVPFLPFLKRTWYYSTAVYVRETNSRVYLWYNTLFCFTYAHILRSIVYTAAVERDTWYIPACCDFVTSMFSLFLLYGCLVPGPFRYFVVFMFSFFYRIYLYDGFVFLCLLSWWRAERQRTLDDRVNEALNSIVRDALSGRPACERRARINGVWSPLRAALIGGLLVISYGRKTIGGCWWEQNAGTTGFWSMDEVGWQRHGSRLVASDDCVRAASEVDVDWSKVSSRTVYISRSRYSW